MRDAGAPSSAVGAGAGPGPGPRAGVVPDAAWDVVTRDCWDALGTVRDPELDQPVTELGFVAALEAAPGTGGTTVHVRLRLPTYFCAPNFAWLMVADARDALLRVPGVAVVDVALLDHFAAAEINEGVAAAADYASRFAADGPAEDPELAGLRRLFEVKAHRAAQDRLARALAAAGVSGDDLLRLRLRDAARQAPEATAAVVRRRQALGLVADDEAPVVVSDDGSPVPAAALPQWLRLARATRVSIEGNATLCRGLLDTRYGSTGSMVEPAP